MPRLPAHGKLRNNSRCVRQVTHCRLQMILYEGGVANRIPEFSTKHWMPREKGMTEFRDHLRSEALGMLPQSLQMYDRGLSWREGRERIYLRRLTLGV